MKYLLIKIERKLKVEGTRSPKWYDYSYFIRTTGFDSYDEALRERAEIMIRDADKVVRASVVSASWIGHEADYFVEEAQLELKIAQSLKESGGQPT